LRALYYRKVVNDAETPANAPAPPASSTVASPQNGTPIDAPPFGGHDQLRFVTDTMSAPVAWCSRDLRFVWVSREYAKRLDLTPEQMTGRPIAEVLGAATFDSLRPHIERVLSGQRVEYELEADLTGGGKQWYSCSYTPARDKNGETTGWVALVTNITDRKALEHGLREEARRKDEFLAVLAHELRNPLAPIRSAVRFLRLNQTPEPKTAWAHDVIERQVDHLVRLVDDLLDVARISRGKIELRKEQTDIASIVERAVETSRPIIEAAKHHFTIKLPDEPMYVDADVTRIAQVLSNLLNNAAKYTHEGGHIELAVEATDTEAVLRVRDDGIGIPAEMLTRIFDMFTQVDASIVRTQGGLGIGLTIAKRMVEMHGGRLEAASEGVGRGSTFTVRLPLDLAQSEAHIAAKAAGTERLQGGKRLRVLIVDDNKDAAESLAMLLSFLGHEVRTASDGPRGIQEAQSLRPDLMLLDIGMPGMDGYEVARRMRQQEATRDATIVALTGWGKDEDRRHSREAGFDQHMVKPPDLAEVEQLIKKLQNRRR
jgi:PAS domain S-box-containing protein